MMQQHVLRSEVSRLLSVRDVTIPLAIAVFAVGAGAVIGAMADGPPTAVGGYLQSRGSLPVVEFALPLWCAALASARAGERRHGVDSVVALAVPRPARRLVSAGGAAALAGAVVGAGVGVVSAATAIGAVPFTSILAHAGRGAVVFAVLSVAAVGLGMMLRSEITAWVIVLSWCLVGERLIASLPGLGDAVGSILPIRSADYFLYADARGAPYPWAAATALAVPVVWAVVAYVIGAVNTLPRKERNV